jgi:hypothetical protein
MSSQPPTNAPPIPHLAHPELLAQQTQAFADQLYQTVGDQYLEFRRTYFHDANASLATEPPPHPEAHQTETAKLAGEALKVIPSGAQSLPVIGDLLTHLRRVVDIHSLTEDELLTLHNVAMIFLYGIRGGVQGWYVDYLLDAAHQLQHVSNTEYFITYPWHGLFHLPQAETTAFDAAVQHYDVAAIENQVQQFAGRLVNALQHPFKAQEELAFVGDGGETRKTVFGLKTTAGLAIGAYLAIETVRSLVGPHQQHTTPQPVIQMIPNQMQQYLIPRDQNTQPAS